MTEAEAQRIINAWRTFKYKLTAIAEMVLSLCALWLIMEVLGFLLHTYPK